MSTFPKVRFQGADYILVEGALTTVERYEQGLCSYAHMYEDGKVRRFREVIGSADEIETVGECEAEPPDLGEAFCEMLSGYPWVKGSWRESK